MAKKKVKVLKYNVVFTPEEEGGYSAFVPDLPGCISQGETFEETKKNITEAIELYLVEADEELHYITPEKARKQFMAPVQVSLPQLKLGASLQYSEAKPRTESH